MGAGPRSKKVADDGARNHSTGINWIHLSDLHRGAKGETRDWPVVRDALGRDLVRMRDIIGSPDLVLFTGDLAYKGDGHEYAQVEELLNWLDSKLGSELPVFAVPGNHDLARPKNLENLSWLYSNDELAASMREKLFTGEPSAVATLFSDYQAFAERRLAPRLPGLVYGKLPGDARWSVEIGGIKLGLLGLNSAWRQASGHNYQGHVSVSPYQAHALLEPDGADAFRDTHHLVLLLQHHPPSWLADLPRWRSHVASAAHAVLLGHLHDNRAEVRRSESNDDWPEVMARSLCGLKNYGTCEEDRRFGYCWGRAELVDLGADGPVTRVRSWSRTLVEGERWEFAHPESSSGYSEREGMRLVDVPVPRPVSGRFNELQAIGATQAVRGASPASCSAPPYGRSDTADPSPDPDSFVGSTQADQGSPRGTSLQREAACSHHSQRHWTVLGGSYLSTEGFLDLPSEVVATGISETGALADTRVQVLLGEPGMGKSTELQRLADALKLQHPGDLVRLIDLRGVGSHDHLREALSHATELPAEGRLWLLLDSFDECLLRVSTLPDALPDAVAGRDLSRMFLRIACRTGAWPSSLQRRLHETWQGHVLEDQDTLEVLELLPMRRSDAQAWIQRQGREAEEVMDSVSRLRLGALAARPVTLRLLLDTTDGRALKEGRSVLCAAAVKRLTGEWSDRRREAASDPARLRRRLVAAGRIATVLILGERATVSLNPISTPQGSISLSEIIGPERDGSGNWSIDEGVLDDVLRDSALFTAVGTCGRRFTHHTFAEYLAARHLVDHGFTGLDALALLLPRGADEVAPDLRGLAAWLAAVDPDTRRELGKVDPMVLLRTDPAVLDSTQRAALVAHVLKAREAGENAEDSREDDFRALSYPGLEDQLRPALSHRPDLHPARALALRRTAARIAAHTRLHALTSVLLGIALDPDEEQPMRAAAAHAAKDLDQDLIHVEQWLQLAHGAAGPDPDHELRGVALQALWPQRRDLLDLGQVLDVKPRRNYFGSLALFAGYVVPKHLDITELPVLLCLHGRTTAPLPLLADRLWRAVYEAAWAVAVASDEVLLALVDSAYRLSSRHQHLPLVPDTAEPRHRFIEALLADPRCQEDTLWMMGFGPPGLLRRTDLAWVIEGVRCAPNEKVMVNYRNATRLCFDIEDSVHVSLLLDACEELPELQAWWGPALFDPVELGSPRAEQMKIDYERSHPPKPPLIDPPPSARVAERLRKCETDPEWFQQLLNELTLELDSTHYGNPYQGDLRELPGWEAADAETRSRILRCAERYLATQDPEPATWFGSRSLPHRALAGKQAALLLQAEEPAVLGRGSGIWERWTATFIELSGVWSTEASADLVRRATREAPKAVKAGLVLRLTQAADDSDYQIALQRTDLVWSPEIAALVSAEAHRTDLTAERRTAALSRWFVHERGDPKDLEALEQDASLPMIFRARAAVHRFHHHGSTLPGDWWEKVQADEELAEAVSLGLNDWRIRLEGETLEQPASVLLALYRWLTARRGYETAAWIDSDLFVATSPTDWREELRRRLPNWLVHRADPEDVAALEELVADEPFLLHALDEARARRHQADWKPLEPRQIVAMLRNGPEQAAPSPDMEQEH